MRFQVPQFIDIEDQIFGSLTIKQFIYIAGGAGLTFIVFRFTSLIITIPLGIVIVGFSLALAFYKINNKPLVYVIQSAFNFYLSNKLYLWKRKDKPLEKNSQSANLPGQTPLYVPKLSEGKLRDLTWSLDIKESLNPVTREEK